MSDVNRKQMEANARHCAQRDILIPTFAQMKQPETMPDHIKEQLMDVGLWDIHPANLFRITWKNEQQPQGGGFGPVNYLEIPSELTGVKARIFGLWGKWFPTGAHKVGATFGCLVPNLVSGQFDPSTTKAVWPSTGNYCRGGAYVSKLLGCSSIAMLPEGMSRERFDWLANVADEVIKTPGCESNVKEIFDKCWELRATRDDIHIFNQFEELGNTLWHYEVTGSALEEVIREKMRPGDRFAGTVLTSGSGGTLACAYYLKEQWPGSKLAVGEALQCATLLQNGFGDHRIEGIGDKHVPWIHDLKNTDMVIAVDDEDAIRLMRLFNEPIGREILSYYGVCEDTISRLDGLGISCIANLISAIKFARYYELGEQDIVVTVFTDSMELYGSRLRELRTKHGVYMTKDAHRDMGRLMNFGIDNMMELGYYERKRIHNLKYYTWMEQQHRLVEELNAQWYQHRTYWPQHLHIADQVDQQIMEFNDMIEQARKKK